MTSEKESQQHRRPNRRPPSATSKTPRRRNNTNPQSSSPPRKQGDDDDDDNNVKQDLPEQLLSTPLHTLTSLLQQSHNYQQSTLQLFRTSHSLHRHAIDRKTKAEEAFRLAQAELEHATTAEEFAMQELQRAKAKKDGASDTYTTLTRDVTKVSKQYKGVRVALVNLQHNSNWNGRRGTIVKLITDGADEDVGRWKVKLDSNWRGKEPDGNYSPFEVEGSDDLNVQMLSQDRSHVVAKAENLKLIDNESESGGVDVPSFLEGDAKLQSKMGSSSISAEDAREKHHPLDPVEELPDESYHNVVTPERRGGRRRAYSNNISHQPSSPPQDGEYEWKRNALGSHHSPPGYYERGNSIVHHAPAMHHSQVQQGQEGPPQQKHLQPIHGHHQQHPTQQHYSSPRIPKQSPKNSHNMQQQRVYIRNQVSSSYHPEMVSPEQFAPVSFQIETSESFTQRNASLPSSSFFEEASPHEDVSNVPNHKRYNYQNENNAQEERSNTGRGTSQPSSIQPNSLPTVVILPVDGESDAGNRDCPPTCIGVQNAGISHVNGLYALAQNNGEEESQQQPHARSNNAEDVPPLYFRDAEPILLSDGRYYDMCILRIDCPDSPEYVIWFLSRVDIDPNCLDVKFSDCYYYCRVLRSVGLHAPPMAGWNIPDVQQSNAVAFSTKDEEEEAVSSSVKSGQRLENDQARLHSSMSSGLGIVPRSAENDYV